MNCPTLPPVRQATAMATTPSMLVSPAISVSTQLPPWSTELKATYCGCRMLKKGRVILRSFPPPLDREPYRTLLTCLSLPSSRTLTTGQSIPSTILMTVTQITTAPAISSSTRSSPSLVRKPALGLPRPRALTVRAPTTKS